MQRDRAIALHHAALRRIVAALVVLAGGGMVARLPRPVYRAVLRVLYPAEAAMRRLIVIAAAGMGVTPGAPRPLPKELLFAANTVGRLAFRLFDARKRFEPKRASATAPRIYVSGPGSCMSLFHPAPAPKPDIDAAQLNRRLAALKTALETLPRQARRLLRWRARRGSMKAPKFTSPLRPGPPPGHRKLATEDIDFLLRECHALAWEALAPNTS